MFFRGTMMNHRAQVRTNIFRSLDSHFCEIENHLWGLDHFELPFNTREPKFSLYVVICNGICCQVSKLFHSFENAQIPVYIHTTQYIKYVCFIMHTRILGSGERGLIALR